MVDVLQFSTTFFNQKCGPFCETLFLTTCLSIFIIAQYSYDPNSDHSKVKEIQKMKMCVRFLNLIWKPVIFSSGFLQHTKTRPFQNRPTGNHFKTGQVQFWNPCCVQIFTSLVQLGLKFWMPSNFGWSNVFCLWFRPFKNWLAGLDCFVWKEKMYFFKPV